MHVYKVNDATPHLDRCVDLTAKIKGDPTAQ
ncbi:hypothetical protein A2U01_0117372, partial [Trifolium medium]|nr:hypothetical protein [Trifolium medium]